MNYLHGKDSPNGGEDIKIPSSLSEERKKVILKQMCPTRLKIIVG